MIEDETRGQASVTDLGEFRQRRAAAVTGVRRAEMDEALSMMFGADAVRPDFEGTERMIRSWYGEDGR